MDIEHLTKSQIILLTLFTSFVTSIATGIVTFSLMQQAPPTITQTVNRIVERTIEKAVPGHVTALAAAPSKTIIVKENETIASAVQTVAPSVVRIYTRDGENQKFLGFGVVLTGSGLLATDASILAEAADAVAELSDATRVRVFVQRRDDSSGIAFLVAATSSPAAPEWKPIGLTSAPPVLGQSVVALSGKSAVRLGVGVVVGIDPASNASTIRMIDTNIANTSIISGTPLIDENGTLVGISTSMSRTASASAFIPADALVSVPEK